MEHIFLPILDNHASVADKIYENLLQRAKSARQIAVGKHTLKQILTMLRHQNILC